VAVPGQSGCSGVPRRCRYSGLAISNECDSHRTTRDIPCQESSAHGATAQSNPLLRNFHNRSLRSNSRRIFSPDIGERRSGKPTGRNPLPPQRNRRRLSAPTPSAFPPRSLACLPGLCSMRAKDRLRIFHPIAERPRSGSQDRRRKSGAPATMPPPRSQGPGASWLHGKAFEIPRRRAAWVKFSGLAR